jgi:endonuclease/exonuclease/phosphatase (EEP) superfamily protein YafD
MEWSQPTQHLRILTCNVHGEALDGRALGGLIAKTKPDIVMLQEAYSAWESIERYAGDVRWICRRDGELFVASRYPIENAEDFGETRWQKWGGAAVRYDIAGPAGVIHLFNIHLASPHLQFQGVIDQKAASDKELEGHLQVRSRQSEKLSALAREVGPNAILGGDFNTICEGAIYHRSWSHFSDAFSVAGSGTGHTYFGEGAALRIDHIFSGAQWRCLRCWVGPDVGSPHRPLIADMEGKVEAAR